MLDCRVCAAYEEAVEVVFDALKSKREEGDPPVDVLTPGGRKELFSSLVDAIHDKRDTHRLREHYK